MVQHVGTKYVQYISREIHNKTVVNITAPVHSPQVLVRHDTWEALVRTGQTNIQVACQAQSSMLKAAGVSNLLGE